MKIAYAGTPEFSVKPLLSLLDAGFEVAAVITMPDRPTGRKRTLTPPPLKVAAIEKEIPVCQFSRIRDCADEVKSLGCDVMVTCAYGQILTQEILDLFPLGVYNIHASLLPKYRGAAPVQWALINGEKETGVTIMKTDIGLDTGDIAIAERTQIHDTETAGELLARLSEIGSELIVAAMSSLEKGDLKLTAQNESDASKVGKLLKSDAELDFCESAERVVNRVRGCNPEPVAFAKINGLCYNIYGAKLGGDKGDSPCGEVVTADPKLGLFVAAADRLVEITEIQKTGGKKLSAAELIRGRGIFAGERFTKDNQ